MINCFLLKNSYPIDDGLSWLSQNPQTLEIRSWSGGTPFSSQDWETPLQQVTDLLLGVLEKKLLQQDSSFIRIIFGLQVANNIFELFRHVRDKRSGL